MSYGIYNLTSVCQPSQIIIKYFWFCFLLLQYSCKEFWNQSLRTACFINSKRNSPPFFAKPSALLFPSVPTWALTWVTSTLLSGDSSNNLNQRWIHRQMSEWRMRAPFVFRHPFTSHRLRHPCTPSVTRRFVNPPWSRNWYMK